MEKIAEFFKDLKERFSSPIFSSFILAWLICNWKILIGILFYKNSELHLDGYYSYIDLIRKNSNTLNFLWEPLIVAITYTFLFPFIRNLIIAFNAWIRYWGNDWNLRISKSGKISVEKYIELRDIYQDRTKILETVLEKESKYLSDNEELRNQNLQLTSESNDIKSQLAKWQSSNNISFLNGDWKFITKDVINENQNATWSLFISNGMFRFTDNSNEDDDFTIDFISTNLDSRLVSFSITPRTKDNPIKKTYYTLRLENSFDRLKGKDNWNNDVILERIKDF